MIRLWICGMVASPTPTVAISSDSTSVMVARVPGKEAKVAAVTQPAVPPPAMTISRGEDWLIEKRLRGSPAVVQHRRGLSNHEPRSGAAAGGGGGGGGTGQASVARITDPSAHVWVGGGGAGGGGG